MKKLLRYISITLTVALALSFASIAYAQETIPPTRDEVISELLTRGYPADLLEALDTSLLQDIYNDEDFNFKSYSKESYELQEGGLVQARGSIDSTELELVCIISDNGRDTLTVYYAYDWLELPAFRWIDTIAFSWDEDLYELVPNTFQRYDRYRTQPGTAALTHDSGNRPANASPSGISWSVDLKGYGLNYPIELFGHASFQLSGTPTQSNFYSRYFHQMTADTLIVPIPEFGPIEIPSPARGDSRPLTTEYDPLDAD